MATSAIPPFNASQSTTHVFLEVQTNSCSSACQPRAVVDNGNIFGLACLHSHLPLVFPNETLVDGTSKLGEAQTSSVTLDRTESIVKVGLLKRQEGRHVERLEELKPSVFPLLESDEEGQNEERMFGLEMLQRGVEAMKTQGLTNEKSGDSSSSSFSSSSTSTPRPPRVPRDAKTRVHECFNDGLLDADERASRRVAAYEAEEKRWDEGMYLDNFVDEDEEVKHLIQATLEPPPDHHVHHQNTLQSVVTTVMQRDMSLLLLEILLAQSYDHRTTSGEATVESAWTVAVLCRSLVTSCLPSSQFGDSIASILIGSMRRQLSFPLYRSWKLSLKVASDVISSLRKQQARSLLSYVAGLFDEAEDEAMAVYSAEVITPLVDNYEHWFR